MRAFLFALLALSSQLACALDESATRTSRETFADLGDVAIISGTAAPPRDLLLIFDASASPSEPLFDLARRGHLIAHMPLAQFLDRAGHNECLTAVTLLDVFSQHLQKEFHFTHYQRPLLIGIDAAAPFALATLAQAPSGLFQAGFGIGFRPELNLPAPLCPAAALNIETIGARHSGNQQFRLGAIAPSTHWRTLTDLKAVDSAISALVGQPSTPANSKLARIDDLPLVELPASVHNGNTPSDTFVVLISGDGGWANIDKDIGETLNRAGLPVVGWNSLQYFWRKKTPEQASADLAQVITHYQQIWQRPRVLLIGYSLGADVLPFMISRLPAATRLAINDIVFLSLGHQVDFEFHVTDWLGSSNTQARPIAPELAKLSGLPQLCVYGKDDDDSLCADHPVGLDINSLPGDHHFNGDYQSASQLILEHLAKTRNISPSGH